MAEGAAVRAGLQPWVTNALPASMDGADFVCGIIGDSPSKSARSPVLWNAAFRALGWNAAFVALDVRPGDLGAVVKVARELPDLRGFAVTMPYKVEVLGLLDHVDSVAAAIGAVNTIAREGEAWVGYNTDAAGFAASLTRPWPGRGTPFFPGLDRRKVLLLGGGGAARAVAFALGPLLGPNGRLDVANRDGAKARALARAVAKMHGNATPAEAADVAVLARRADLVVNASTLGQAGIRRVGAEATCLEPYSSLAGASPALLPASLATDESAFFEAWFRASRPDILANHAASADVLAGTPRSTRIVDVIFAPAETVLLQHARLSGHATLNGRPMNLAQAVIAFVHRVLPGEVRACGLDPARAEELVLEAMSKVP